MNLIDDANNTRCVQVDSNQIVISNVNQCIQIADSCMKRFDLDNWGPNDSATIRFYGDKVSPSMARLDKDELLGLYLGLREIFKKFS